MATKATNDCGEHEDKSRLQLLEKVMELEDNLADLTMQMKHKEEQNAALERELATQRETMEGERKEYDQQLSELRNETDMLQQKNAVLSNLLDIVQERCEQAEMELCLYRRDSSATPSEGS